MPQTKIQEIPLDQIADLPQPRKELGVDSEDNRLLLSLKEDGLGSAITVTEIGPNRYKILNGHRRYKCAQMLQWKTIRCEVHPKSQDNGYLEKLRFNLQTNVRPWKPPERAQEIERIRDEKELTSNKEVAAYLHYPETLVSSSLALQKKRKKYQELMNEYELSDAYQGEFVKLYPKIRQIREFTTDAIIRNLFSRVQHQVIKSAKDFRKLSSVFLRAHANEDELYAFLKDPDMKVGPLYEQTDRSGYVRDLETVLRKTADKLSKGGEFSADEEAVLQDFFELLNKRKVAENP